MEPRPPALGPLTLTAGPLPPIARALLFFLALLPWLAGCDTPDLRNVVFKPALEDPEAYKNAFRAYFVTAAQRQQPWGNEFLTRRDLVLGQDREPLTGLAVRIDGLESRADHKGFLALERLRTGFHALEVPAGSASHRLTFPIEKGRMTLCLFELSPGGRSVATYTVRPHAFLLTQPYRELSEMHRRVQELLDALEGRPDEIAFADALATGYADRTGGRADLLKARAFLAAGGRLPGMRILRATVSVIPGQGDAVVLYSSDGQPGLARFSLTGGRIPDSPWRLVAVSGRNPFSTREELLAAGPPLPALPAPPRQKSKPSGLGRDLRGAASGSLFKPEESGVVEHDPFSAPVVRAQPDLSLPGYRIDPGAFTGPPPPASEADSAGIPSR